MAASESPSIVFDCPHVCDHPPRVGGGVYGPARRRLYLLLYVVIDYDHVVDFDNANKSRRRSSSIRCSRQRQSTPACPCGQAHDRLRARTSRSLAVRAPDRVCGPRPEDDPSRLAHRTRRSPPVQSRIVVGCRFDRASTALASPKHERGESRSWRLDAVLCPGGRACLRVVKRTDPLGAWKGRPRFRGPRRMPVVFRACR